MTSSDTACGPVSREGVALGPTRLSVWGQRVLVCGPGMRVALEARLLAVWGASWDSYPRRMFTCKHPARVVVVGGVGSCVLSVVARLLATSWLTVGAAPTALPSPTLPEAPPPTLVLLLCESPFRFVI